MSDTKYSVKSGFYDAINHDRLYSADDMNQPYKEIMTEGIDANGFAVTPQSTPDMTINVAAGHAFLGGKWVDSIATTMDVPANTALYGRIDSVILRVDVNSEVREANLIYRTGTPADTPEAPVLIGTTGIYEVRLANIAVAASATAIAAAQITDKRGGSDCPYADIKLGQLVREQQIAEEVSSWLTEHVDPVGSAVVVDDSLSIAGAAADAKATGDAIADLNNDLSDIIDYSSSTITPQLVDGFANVNSLLVSDKGYDGLYKRTDYIPIPAHTAKITSNFRNMNAGGGVFFDASKTGISSFDDQSEVTSIPSTAKYFVLTDYAVNANHDGRTYKIELEYSSLVDLQNQIDDIDHSANITNLVTYGDSHVARGLWQPAVVSYFGIASHTNLGVGSSCVAINSESSQPPFVDADRISAIETANPDTIIIIGGTNDVHLGTPMGQASELKVATSSKDKTTFYGAYGYLIETLFTWKPTLQIIIATPPQGYYDSTYPTKYQDIAEAVKVIGEFYSIPVMDIFGKCGINKINLATYSDDLIHYNATGNVRVSGLAIATIKDSYVGYKLT